MVRHVAHTSSRGDSSKSGNFAGQMSGSHGGGQGSRGAGENRSSDCNDKVPDEPNETGNNDEGGDGGVVDGNVRQPSMSGITLDDIVRCNDPWVQYERLVSAHTKVDGQAIILLVTQPKSSISEAQRTSFRSCVDPRNIVTTTPGEEGACHICLYGSSVAVWQLWASHCMVIIEAIIVQGMAPPLGIPFTPPPSPFLAD